MLNGLTEANQKAGSGLLDGAAEGEWRVTGQRGRRRGMEGHSSERLEVSIERVGVADRALHLEVKRTALAHGGGLWTGDQSGGETLIRQGQPHIKKYVPHSLSDSSPQCPSSLPGDSRF